MLCAHCQCDNNQHLFNCPTLTKKFLETDDENNVYAFRGKYNFLSNFSKSKVEIFGVVCETIEHAYQAAKTEINSERNAILYATTPAEAKKLGTKTTIRSDWNEIKLGVMENLLRQKFAEGTELLEKLKNISGEIAEGNWWCDVWWGMCACDKHQGEGLNNLGKLLMKIRDEAIKGKQ